MKEQPLEPHPPEGPSAIKTPEPPVKVKIVLDDTARRAEFLRVSGEFFRNTFLPAFLQVFKKSSAGMRAAENFFSGKGKVSVSIPATACSELFGTIPESGIWRSSMATGDFFSTGSEDRVQNILDSLCRSLVVQISEADSAYVRTKLKIPRSDDVVVLELKPQAEHFNFEFSLDASRSDLETIPGISISVQRKEYHLHFDDPTLDESLDSVDQENIDLVLKKLNWFLRYLNHVGSAELFGKIRIVIHGLLPEVISSRVSALFYASGSRQNEKFAIEDLIRQYIVALTYKKTAKTEQLSLNRGSEPVEVRLPGVTVEALDKYGFDYKESFERDGFTFFILPVHQNGNQLKALFYVYDGTTLYLRLAYKSRSNQRWRIHSAHSWRDVQMNNFGKGVFSYTFETIPCAELDALLIKMERDAIPETYETNYVVSALDSENNTYRKEISRGQNVSGFPFSIDSAADVVQFPSNFIPDFSGAPISSQKRPSSPFFPEGFEVEEFHYHYEGRKIRIDMAHNESGDVWIDRVECLDVPINSYGIQSKFTDFNPLTLKPFEYEDQVPPSLKDLTDTMVTDDVALMEYVKQTRILDLLPLVQKYRKERHVFRRSEA